MREKQALDISIVLCEVTGIVLVYLHIEDIYIKTGLIAAMALAAIIFMIVLFKDSRRYLQGDMDWVGNGAVTQIILLSEENTETASWDIYGKTSIVLGRDCSGPGTFPEAPIDIDLSNTALAASVDREHAVMNYYNGGWYLEDMESENGVRVQRAGEADKCRISPGTPFRINREDIIYLGLAKLKIK